MAPLPLPRLASPCLQNTMQLASGTPKPLSTQWRAFQLHRVLELRVGGTLYHLSPLTTRLPTAANYVTRALESVVCPPERRAEEMTRLRARRGAD